MTAFCGGKNNWYNVGWDKHKVTWQCLSPARYLNTNWKDECDTTAKLIIGDRPNLTPYIALTGGIDSEMVANCFVRNDIDFKVVMVDVAGYNHQELTYAYHWCEQNNITPIIKKFNASELVLLSRQYFKDLCEVKNMLLSPVIWLMDWISGHNGYIVYSAGDINYDLEQKKFYSDSMDYLIDYLRPGQHPSSFFMYTPELAASYISQFDPNVNERSNKFKFYDVVPRPKLDYIIPFSEDAVYNKEFMCWAYYVTSSKCYSERNWFGTKEYVLSQLLE